MKVCARQADGVDLIEVDSLALLEQRFAGLASLASIAAGHEHGDRFALPAPEELTGLPGVEELLALSEVARLADSGRWHTVIVDAPASADAVRMLAAPRTISDYMDRIWPQHSRVEAAIGPDPRLTVVVALFDRVLSGIAATRDLFENPDRTTAVLVSTPDRAGRARDGPAPLVGRSDRPDTRGRRRQRDRAGVRRRRSGRTVARAPACRPTGGARRDDLDRHRGAGGRV